MLNNLFKIILICLFLSSVALCKELGSDEQKINSAIEILKSYGYNESITIIEGGNYTKKPVRIIFKDLSELNFSYAKHYAITANDSNGDLYILINKDLKYSSVKALACLILHEVNHCKYNKPDSLSEEIFAHTQETMLYMRLLADDETLQNKENDRLITRLNKLKKIYDDAIRLYLGNNSTYVNFLK